MRNTYAHAAVAPYAVRARPEAPVATPLHPGELDDPQTRPDRWTVRTLVKRLDRGRDPWKPIGKHPQTLTDARRRLAQLLAENDEEMNT